MFLLERNQIVESCYFPLNHNLGYKIPAKRYLCGEVKYCQFTQSTSIERFLYTELYSMGGGMSIMWKSTGKISFLLICLGVVIKNQFLNAPSYKSSDRVSFKSGTCQNSKTNSNGTFFVVPFGHILMERLYEIRRAHSGYIPRMGRTIIAARTGRSR